jgi:hypothetical protein
VKKRSAFFYWEEAFLHPVKTDESNEPWELGARFPRGLRSPASCLRSADRSWAEKPPGKVTKGNKEFAGSAEIREEVSDTSGKAGGLG